MSERKIIQSDGRGIMAGDYLQMNREMNKDIWLKETFPIWGSFLNKEIENEDVKPGTTSIWWLGGPSWILKTDEGAIFLIDVFSGPSHYTQYHFCGVCRQAGAETINWLRLNPMVIDPWEWNRIDAVMSTHRHPDHCDIYTVKAATQTTDCKFVGPPDTAEKFKYFDVPEERIIKAKIGESVKFPGVEIEFLLNFDETVVRTEIGRAHV